MIITISGTPLSGKNTIGEKIAEKLGYKFYSIGDIMKQHAKEKKLSLHELNKKAEKDDKIDTYLDEELKKLVKKNDLVITTRTGFYFIPKSIKIFIKCDLDVAAKRLLKDIKNRKTESQIKTQKDAMKLIQARITSERKRYKKYYKIDYLDESKYDIIINTTGRTKQENINRTMNEIIEKISE